MISSFQRTSWRVVIFGFINFFGGFYQLLHNNKQAFSELQSYSVLFLSILFPKQERKMALLFPSIIPCSLADDMPYLPCGSQAN